MVFAVAFLNTVKVKRHIFKSRKKCISLKVVFNGSLTFPDTLKAERLASVTGERGVCARTRMFTYSHVC